eukprot:CAMPEP_0172557010 /NCGR_PEP_ID=MMETSP1067-20121228/70889_1 /TAXON_ID=265564 ORGANISM="Thalassiosira punctigera, Strain Tpunct2005C2" /NCGR_SAMPLE_ID=MMETSP1067 /ASSEMBLY_ACC=CAM_ASM_000444 /LENGTH=182 /DNA_ID=CAMNT_0013345973 /DNA_START=173 /DNA_END=721 /DNA_ORIENTATION=-
MEPALHHGDVLLVRKSDVFPHAMWRRWMSAATSYEEEEEHQNAVKVMAHDAQSGRPIGEFWTGRTYLTPPTVHRPGSIIVFRAPDAERYPSSEYRVKRVAGLGGQLCRAGGEYHRLERVPSYALWMEGDNWGSDGSRSIDSRTYGAVCKSNVIGIAERIVWPPSRWRELQCVTSSMPRSWWE